MMGVFMLINNVEIAVQRKNIKSIHLSVYPPQGTVKISVPLGTSESYIKNFALSKWTWITEKRSQILTTYKEAKEKEYVSGESHLLFGTEYRLFVQVNSNEAQNVCIDGDYIKVTVKNKENVKSTLEDFYKVQLQERIERFISKWEEVLKVKCEGIKYRTMKTRWGSCIPEKKSITFNINLAQKDIECVEYVVVHELIHLIEPNHSTEFYRILEKNIPNWKILRKRMN